MQCLYISGDLNTGGIVAGVIIFLLLLALLGFGIWYAYKKGYLPSKFTVITDFYLFIVLSYLFFYCTNCFPFYFYRENRQVSNYIYFKIILFTHLT